MRGYALVFMATYVLCTLVGGAAMAAANVQGSAGLNVACVLAASYVAAWRFTKREGRVPEAAEKARFAKLALGGIWLSSLLLVVGYFGAIAPASDARRVLGVLSSPRALGLLLAVVAVLSIIYYFAIKWSFSWLAWQSERRGSG
jgi:hypothetical protein